MKETATQVLSARAVDPDGLGRMFTLSLAGHGLVIACLIFMPEAWSHRAVQPPPDVVMTISLAGPPGPRTGGMSPLPGRPVQLAIPLPPAPRPRAVRVPARAEPEMVVPTPTARRREVQNPPDVESSPQGARGRMLAEGDEERPGDALGETAAQGLGFGLSTGGAGGTGGYLDVGDFCCPEYLSTMLDLVRRNWDANQQVPGDVLVMFTVQRDGRLVNIAVERTSGYVGLDLAAQRALALTAQLPPLPSAFPDSTLTVHLNFQYQR